MELRVLRYFIALTNHQTVSNAAKFLNITQPTLSRQLSELEEELGTKLFIRGNRQITLTNDGKYFLIKAKEITRLADKVITNFKNSTEIISGEIHIGSGESDVMKFIAHSIKQLTDMHKDIQIHLLSGNSEATFEKLDAGLLDFGIIVDPVDKKNYNSIQLPISDNWGVLMPENSTLAEKEYITSKNLLDLPLIISQQAIIYDELSGWFGKDLKELNICCTYNLIYNAAKMVEANLGYAICLDKLIETYPTNNLVFRPLFPKLTANLYLVWKKHQVFSKASSAFLEQLRFNIEQYQFSENKSDSSK